MVGIFYFILYYFRQNYKNYKNYISLNNNYCFNGYLNDGH